MKRHLGEAEVKEKAENSKQQTAKVITGLLLVNLNLDRKVNE